jgi:hypothetical protein
MKWIHTEPYPKGPDVNVYLGHESDSDEAEDDDALTDVESSEEKSGASRLKRRRVGKK